MSTLKYSLTTPPSTEPVSRAEAKVELRIPTAETGDDSKVDALILTARMHCENVTNRKFITQTYKLFLDAFPCGAPIEIPFGALQSITTIKYYDTDGVLQTLDSSKYQVEKYGIIGEVYLAPNESWPDVQSEKVNPIEVTFVCGYGNSATDVPTPIRQVMLMVIRWLYDGQDFEDFKGTISTLLGSYRIIHIS